MSACVLCAFVYLRSRQLERTLACLLASLLSSKLEDHSPVFSCVRVDRNVLECWCLQSDEAWRSFRFVSSSCSILCIWGSSFSIFDCRLAQAACFRSVQQTGAKHCGSSILASFLLSLFTPYPSKLRTNKSAKRLDSFKFWPVLCCSVCLWDASSAASVCRLLLNQQLVSSRMERLRDSASSLDGCASAAAAVVAAWMLSLSRIYRSIRSV